MQIHRLLILLLFQLIHISIYAQNINEELILAARKSNVEAVKALLAKGADVNTKTEYGATPLFYACDRGSIEIVKILLNAGADVNITDKFYNSPPVFWAVMKDHGAVVKLLLEKGARTKESVMSSAAGQGKKNVVKSVLELGGFSPDALTAYLAAAEKNGHTEVAEMLKNAGAKPKPKVEYKVDAETLKIYEGVYKNDQLEFTFRVKDGKLVGGPAGQEITLVPVDKHTFEPDGAAGVTGVFSVEGEKVISLTVKQSGGQVVLKKVEAK
ncbi:MAG: ankyrin repeat domain-containing protein [Acidobacteria bacterium]|nr:ankyrin repeat domain-containing protein [Acidobacteriota bacterium]